MEDIISSPPPDNDLGLLNKPLLRPDHSPASPLDPQTVDTESASAAKESTAAAAEANQDTPWLLIVALCILYFTFSGIENGLSPCLFTTFQADFNNASTTIITTAHGMTEIFKIVGAPLIGHFSNKIKPLALSVGAVIWCVGSWSLGGATSVGMLFIGFSVIGFGFSFLTVLTPAILEEHCVREQVAKYLGIIYACSPLGVAVFFVICGATADTSAWRYLYAIVAPALTAVPLIMLARTAMKDMCAGGARNVAETAMAAIAEPDLPYWATMRKFISQTTIVFLLLEMTFQTFFVSAMISLLPKYLESLSSKETAAMIMAATVPAALLGTLVGGFIVKRWNPCLKQQLHFCLWTNFATIPLIAAMFVDSAVPFWLVAVLLPAAMFIVFLNAAPSISLLALLCTTKKEVVRIQSLMNVVSRSLGAVPGPIVLGALIDASDHVDPTSSLAFSHCYLAIGVGGGCMTCVCAALALCFAPDIGSAGQFGDETKTGGDENAAAAAIAAGDQEMTSGGGIGFPAVEAAHGKGALHMPKMIITEPSRSPVCTPLDGRAGMSEPDAIAAEWESAGLLAAPENSFLSPDAQADVEEVPTDDFL